MWISFEVDDPVFCDNENVKSPSANGRAMSSAAPLAIHEAVEETTAEEIAMVAS